MSNALAPQAVFPLTGSAQVIYTVPNATTFTVGNLHLANPTGGAVVVTLYLVPNAGSPGLTNSVLGGYSLAAGAYIEILKGSMWPAGTTLQGFGLGATVMVSGIQTV